MHLFKNLFFVFCPRKKPAQAKTGHRFEHSVDHKHVPCGLLRLSIFKCFCFLWFCFCTMVGFGFVLVFVGFVLVSRPSRHAALLAPGLPDGGSSTIWSTASPWNRCSRASAQAAPLSRRQARNAASCSRPRESFWRVSSPPAAGDHPGAPPIHLSLGTGGSSVAAKGLPASIAGRTGERVSIRI